MIRILNSYTGEVEEINKETSEVSLFVCGPTVYNNIHIGNARPIITFDVFRRLLEHKGHKVKHVSNITDIDDKIILAAKQANVLEKEIANKYFKQYQKDCILLNVLKPHFQPTVTESLTEIIEIIQELLVKKIAYKDKKGNIWFDISKDKTYGKLSNIKISQLKKDKNKSIDFALWKITTEGIKFNSPWGAGRPGWHTECLAIIWKFFGNRKQIDFHGGGTDLKFPHHTNEIAQSQSLCGHNLAKYWMHNGLVTFKDEKMAKSVGNVKWVKDEITKWGMLSIKLMYLSTHYQKPLNYSYGELKQLQRVANKITTTLEKIYRANIKSKDANQEYVKKVVLYLSDNLNTANALSLLYKAIKDFNKSDKNAQIGGDILVITKILGLR